MGRVTGGANIGDAKRLGLVCVFQFPDGAFYEINLGNLGRSRVLYLPSSQKHLQAKKIKIPGFWIFSLLNYESESERKSLGFYFYS